MGVDKGYFFPPAVPFAAVIPCRDRGMENVSVVASLVFKLLIQSYSANCIRTNLTIFFGRFFLRQLAVRMGY